MPESVYVDLSPVIRSLEHVAANVSVVDGKVEVLYRETEATKDRLEDLIEQFALFVDSDRKAKELQRALTELVRVRQELDKKYGHYDLVRRAALGILQATDAGLVTQQTLQHITEKLMVATPGYWLAPALVGLSSWVKDDRALAEKAMMTAIGRDDHKTSLFFALVCRRARRSDATARWLARYFQMQNPLSMDREVVVMIDGLANGLFGGAALVTCSRVIEQWLSELELQAGFLDEQRQRWAQKLEVMTPRLREDDYPTLLKNSPTASALAASLTAARRHQMVFDFFTSMFTGEIVVPPSLAEAVDEILRSLVRNFDDEELPLRKEERLYLLVKEEAGDLPAARKRHAAEYEVFEEKTNFAALLTNSAMSPQEFGATPATQRYAVSRSREWILAAQNDLTARDRAAIPQTVQLTCGSWQGAAADGAEEARLAKELEGHYAQRTTQALQALKLTGGVWIAVIMGALLGLLMMASSAILFGVVVAGAAAAFFIWKRKELERARENTRQTLQTEREQALKILKACLAELADYRREVAAEDGKSQKVTELLQSLSSPQFVLQRPEISRTVA